MPKVLENRKKMLAFNEGCVCFLFWLADVVLLLNVEGPEGRLQLPDPGPCGKCQGTFPSLVLSLGQPHFFTFPGTGLESAVNFSARGARISGEFLVDFFH